MSCFFEKSQPILNLIKYMHTSIYLHFAVNILKILMLILFFLNVVKLEID